MVHNAGERMEVGQVNLEYLEQMSLGPSNIGKAINYVLLRHHTFNNRAKFNKTKALLHKLEQLEVSTPQLRRSARIAVPFDPNGEIPSKLGKKK